MMLHVQLIQGKQLQNCQRGSIFLYILQLLEPVNFPKSNSCSYLKTAV